MKLSQLAAKPQLIKIIIDDEDTIKEFNEPLEFYTWDRQPLDTFMSLASSQQGENIGSMVSIVRKMILTEEGKEVIQGDMVLPSHILVKAISKIVELLGK